MLSGKVNYIEYQKLSIEYQVKKIKIKSTLEKKTYDRKVTQVLQLLIFYITYFITFLSLSYYGQDSKFSITHETFILSQWAYKHIKHINKFRFDVTIM